jgi:hypothetical protein
MPPFYWQIQTPIKTMWKKYYAGSEKPLSTFVMKERPHLLGHKKQQVSAEVTNRAISQKG